MEGDDEPGTEPSPVAPRAPNKVNAETLSNILFNYVHSARWLRYDESETVANTKVIPLEILKHVKLLEELRNADSSLALNKVTTRQAFEKVLEGKECLSMEDPKEQADWLTTMTRRLRCMCRAVKQTELKKKPPEWALALPWIARKQAARAEANAALPAAAPAAAPAAEAAAPAAAARAAAKAAPLAAAPAAAVRAAAKAAPLAAAPAAATAAAPAARANARAAAPAAAPAAEAAALAAALPDQAAAPAPAPAATTDTARLATPAAVAAEHTASDSYYFGFDKELLSAWRVPVAGGKRQPSLRLEYCPKAGDDDKVTAVWKDGMKKGIDELTVGEWKAMQNASKDSRGGGSNQVWTAEHRITKHKLKVTTKADRSPLAVLEEQGKQVLQVGSKLFPGDDKQQIASALQLCTEIAKAYSDDKIKKSDLYLRRDERLLAMGLATRGKKRAASGGKQPLKKKPAAAKAGDDEGGGDKDEPAGDNDGGGGDEDGEDAGNGEGEGEEEEEDNDDDQDEEEQEDAEGEGEEEEEQEDEEEVEEEEGEEEGEEEEKEDKVAAGILKKPAAVGGKTTGKQKDKVAAGISKKPAVKTTGTVKRPAADGGASRGSKDRGIRHQSNATPCLPTLEYRIE